MKPPQEPETETSKNPTEGRFGPFSAMIVTFLAYLGSQIAALLLLATVYGLITGQNSEEMLERFTNSTTGQFLFVVLAQLFVLAIVYWFIRHRKLKLKEFGLGRGPKISDLGYAALFAVGYFIVTLLVLQLVDTYIPAINVEQEQKIGFESAAGTLQLGFVFIALVIVVPIVEEVLVRGFLYSGLRRKLSRITSALVASVLFGVAHLQLGSGELPLYVVAIDTFILSMFLIALREKTGSLWAGILVHALKNGIAFLALFVFHVA